jgi:hypothetical protein
MLAQWEQAGRINVMMSTETIRIGDCYFNGDPKEPFPSELLFAKVALAVNADVGKCKTETCTKRRMAEAPYCLTCNKNQEYTKRMDKILKDTLEGKTRMKHHV